MAERLPCEVMHLDAAACGRPSVGVARAVADHLSREAATGGYVAEAEAEAAAGALAAGRAALGSLFGLEASQVAFAEGAGAAFATLLDAWPLPAGARVGTVPGEYGGNAAVLRHQTERRGWTLVPLPVDALGRVTSVPASLDLLTVPQVASQRGIAQPVDDLLAAGVPVVLDVAQSLGQTAVPGGCAAYVGTSRKWLCGPRGVGFLAVDGGYERGLLPPPTLAAQDQEGLRRWESQDAHVAGRVGLSVAVQELPQDAAAVAQAHAAALRDLLAAERGWHVVEPSAEPTAITTLLLDGDDPSAVRRRLLQAGFLVSAVPVTRAADLARPVLRVSTAAWVTTSDLTRFAAALRAAA